MKNFNRGGFGARRPYASKSPSQGRSFGGNRFGGRNRNKGESLNPMMFVKKATIIEEAAYVPQNKFADFEMVDALKKNIIDRGYVNPTPIQDEAIKPLLEGRDLVGIANTGTGKTAAFLLPLINKLAQNRQEKVLIVTPTRELAAQIKSEFEMFAKGMGIYATLCIGGASMTGQINGLKRSPGFVIGTPGRLKDLSKRKILRLHEYSNVVLDEVDRMLDMGFILDIREIVSHLPQNRQSLFFSATMPEKTKEVMDSFLNDPVRVSVKTSQSSNNVDQDIVRTTGKDKVELLHELLIKEGFDKVLVFGRTKWGVNKLEEALSGRGFKVASIHGNKSQGQRQRALQQLKTNQVQILLATDVASRGLDIDNVTHVINYDVPESYEDYVHRIGRTGRANKKGVALTFVS